MANKKKTLTLREVTPEFVVGYPSVFQTKLNTLNGKQEYALVALFKKGADLSKLKAAAKAVCEDEWGKDQTKWPKGLRSPFKEQGARIAAAKEAEKPAPQGYVDGAIYLDLKSTQKPGIVDANNQPIIDPTEFYAGCVARATVNVKIYDQAGNRGVSIYLSNLQKLREGDPLGGRPRPEDDFQPIASSGGDSEVNSAADVFG